MSGRKGIGKPTPKAIVTPLVGGVTHCQKHTYADTSHTTSTCSLETECIRKGGMKVAPDDDDLGEIECCGSVEGWRAVLEKKDKILAQKSHLIER